MFDQENEDRAVVAALRRLMSGADRCRRAVAERYDVNVPEVITLADLYQYGPLTPRAIAHRLAWTTGGVTALLDRLTARGYITRVPNPDDRRSLLIQLTDQGKLAMQWAFALFQTAIDKSHNQDMNAAQLAALLDGIANALNQQADHVGPRRPADKSADHDAERSNDPHTTSPAPTDRA